MSDKSDNMLFVVELFCQVEKQKTTKGKVYDILVKVTDDCYSNILINLLE